VSFISVNSVFGKVYITRASHVNDLTFSVYRNENKTRQATV
jgi:hypothetical protein